MPGQYGGIWDMIAAGVFGWRLFVMPEQTGLEVSVHLRVHYGGAEKKIRA